MAWSRAASTAVELLMPPDCLGMSETMRAPSMDSLRGWETSSRGITQGSRDVAQGSHGVMQGSYGARKGHVAHWSLGVTQGSCMGHVGLQVSRGVTVTQGQGFAQESHARVQVTLCSGSQGPASAAPKRS